MSYIRQMEYNTSIIRIFTTHIIVMRYYLITIPHTQDLIEKQNNNRITNFNAISGFASFIKYIFKMKRTWSISILFWGFKSVQNNDGGLSGSIFWHFICWKNATKIVNNSNNFNFIILLRCSIRKSLFLKMNLHPLDNETNNYEIQTDYQISWTQLWFVRVFNSIFCYFFLTSKSSRDYKMTKCFSLNFGIETWSYIELYCVNLYGFSLYTMYGRKQRRNYTY